MQGCIWRLPGITKHEFLAILLSSVLYRQNLEREQCLDLTRHGGFELSWAEMSQKKGESVAVWDCTANSLLDINDIFMIYFCLILLIRNTITNLRRGPLVSTPTLTLTNLLSSLLPDLCTMPWCQGFEGASIWGRLPRVGASHLINLDIHKPRSSVCAQDQHFVNYAWNGFELLSHVFFSHIHSRVQYQ